MRHHARRPGKAAPRGGRPLENRERVPRRQLACRRGRARCRSSHQLRPGQLLDYEETINSLAYSSHDVWNLTSFGVDASRPNHVQLAAGNPGEYRGDETKAAAGIEGLDRRGGTRVTVTAAAQARLHD